LIPLTEAAIHLWLAFYSEINEESLHATYLELLRIDERLQHSRFYFAKDRHRYLVTRALVRTVLSRYLPIHPTQWMFSGNAYGRPEITNSEATNFGLSFNISHTDSLIVLGVTRHRALGVDVENFRGRQASIDIADRYFARQEVAKLAATPPQEQQYRFFEYWTFKEAYIKARGVGLSLPLDKFSFWYPDDRTVEIAIDPEMADESLRWQFWQFRPGSEYLLAVCAERIATGSSNVIVRQVVPMVSEKQCVLEVLRVSRSNGSATYNDHNWSVT